MTVEQVEIPRHFRNLWRISGWIDEHEHATKLCRVLGYQDTEVVVVLLGQGDLFEPGEVRLSPHMLHPVLPEQPRNPRAARAPKAVRT
jgi:hypothetical protein